MAQPPIEIRCSDGCGRAVTEEQLKTSGWTYLAISRRYRCPVCVRELAKANEPPSPRSADDVQL